MKSISFIALAFCVLILSCQKKTEKKGFSQEQIEIERIQKPKRPELTEATLVKHQSKEVEPKSRKDDEGIEFEVLSGQVFFDSGNINLKVEMVDSAFYRIDIETDFPEPKEYSTVWNSSFGKMEKADELQVSLKGSYKGQSFYSEKKRERTNKKFRILPKYFRTVKSGMQKVELVIKGKYVSFFKNESKTEVFRVRVALDLLVFDVYKSNVYFGSFRLNPEKCSEILGADNDNNYKSNVKPDSKISISYLGESEFYRKRKNGYVINSSGVAEIYYVSNMNKVKFGFSDVDGFLNPDDFLCAKEFSFEELNSKKYQLLQFDCVDELRVRAKLFGKVN